MHRIGGGWADFIPNEAVDIELGPPPHAVQDIRKIEAERFRESAVVRWRLMVGYDAPRQIYFPLCAAPEERTLLPFGTKPRFRTDPHEDAS